MKTYREIFEQMKKNKAIIDDYENEICSLDYIDERREAVNAHNMKAWKEYHEKAEKNNNRIKFLCNEIYMLKIENHILFDNAKAAAFSEALPIITEAFRKYTGKAYGPKTKEAISSEVRKAGFSFYLDGYSSTNTIIIEPLNDNGNYYNYTRLDIRAHAEKEKPYITAENKIQFAETKSSYSGREYIENTRERAEAIVKAYKAHAEATEAAAATETAYNNMIPGGLKTMDNIQRIHPTITV